MDLPKKVFVQGKKADFDFFVNLYYEFVLFFCQYCKIIGHKMEACRGAKPKVHKEHLEEQSI